MTTIKSREALRLNEILAYLDLPATKSGVGVEWVKNLRNKRVIIAEEIIEELLSDSFRATDGLRHRIAIIKNTEQNDTIPILSILNKWSEKLSLGSINLEQCCLICDRLSRLDLENLELDSLIMMSKVMVRSRSFDPSLLELSLTYDSKKQKNTTLRLLASETRNTGNQRQALVFDASPVFKPKANYPNYVLRPHSES